MTGLKTESQIKDYENTKASFSDYTYFEDCLSNRLSAKEAFIDGNNYVPEYSYPKMDDIEFNESVVSKKQKIYEAVLELEAAKKYSKISDAELELYAASLEVRLKRIMLVEAARDLYASFDMSSIDTNEKTFIDINESLYGKLDKDMYFGIMNTEKSKLDAFIPNNDVAESIKNDLENYYSKVEIENSVEKDLLSPDDLKKLHDYVFDHYGDILAVVPDTPDDKYYNASECAEIISKALAEGGLGEWKSEVNPVKTAVSTSTAKKRIFLPSNTSRNAIELRRLIMHEQEVHARRAENGMKSGLKILKEGTADYTEIEEGLGVILECAVNGNLDNASFKRARNRYIVAGLALGADGHPRNARETFENMWRIIAIDESQDGIIDDKEVQKAKDSAYTLVENAYRGSQFWMDGIIYSKLKIYYEGLVANAEFFKAHIDNLDNVFKQVLIGKYNHTDNHEYELIKSILKAERNNQENVKEASDE